MEILGLGMVVYICKPSCAGGIHRKITSPGKTMRAYLKNN
jgi:hypothetical protein